MKFVLLQLPIPRSEVLKLFQGGLEHLRQRLRFVRNKSAKIPRVQSDRVLHDFVDTVRLVRGEPVTNHGAVAHGWILATALEPRFRRRLRLALQNGTGDRVLDQLSRGYVLAIDRKSLPAAYQSRAVSARTAALDDFRAYFDAYKFARNMELALRREKSKRAGVAYANTVLALLHVEGIVAALRGTNSTRATNSSARSNAVIRAARNFLTVSIPPVAWSRATLVRGWQADLAALASARTTAARGTRAQQRALQRIEKIFHSFNFYDPNNSDARFVQAGVFVAHHLDRRGKKLKVFKGPTNADVRAGIKNFLKKLDWAGPYKKILQSCADVPLYVLNEYSADSRESRLIESVGKPEAAIEIWGLYGERCAENLGECRPDQGHYVLQFEDAAHRDLEEYQHEILRRITWRRELALVFKKQLTDRFSTEEIAVVVTALINITRGNGGAIFLALQKIAPRLAARRSPHVPAELVEAQLLQALFRAACITGDMVEPALIMEKTIRASEAREFIEKLLRRSGLPMRKPNDPIEKGWLVDLDLRESSGAMVMAGLRKVVLLQLPGDPPIISRSDLEIGLGVHELLHVLRSESSKSQLFARLSTGVSEYLDYEEGMSAFLERLAVPDQISERRVTHALSYFAIALALKNAPPDYVRPAYTWQEIYDLLCAYGLPEDSVFETLRRIVRGTDGKRRPRNLNLRDAVYFRGIKKIEEWLPRAFGYEIFEHVWRDEYKGRTLTRADQAALIKKIRGMHRDEYYQKHFAAAAIVTLLNELMVGKVTPEFVRKLKEHGHFKPSLFLLEKLVKS